MQKKFNLILFGGLALLVITVLLWSIHANRKEIVGTFSTGSGVSSEDLYISFFRKNEVLIFRQDADILKGSYSMEKLGDNVIAKITSSEEALYIAIYNKRDSLLLVGMSPFDIYEFSRTSDVPMIIGHKSD